MHYFISDANKSSLLLILWIFSVNLRDSQALTLKGHTSENLELDPLAVLFLDNQLGVGIRGRKSCRAKRYRVHISYITLRDIASRYGGGPLGRI